MNFAFQILFIFMALFLFFFFVFKFFKNKNNLTDKFNAQQTNLDRTNTYYQEFDMPNEMAYFASEAKLNPASLQTLSKLTCLVVIAYM